MQTIDEMIQNVNENNVDQINWTVAWSKKYPVLAAYQLEVDIPKYSNQIRKLLEALKQEYHYNELDAMLVLKDILYHEWKDSKKMVKNGVKK